MPCCWRDRTWRHSTHPPHQREQIGRRIGLRAAVGLLQQVYDSRQLVGLWTAGRAQGSWQGSRQLVGLWEAGRALGSCQGSGQLVRTLASWQDSGQLVWLGAAGRALGSWQGSEQLEFSQRAQVYWKMEGSWQAPDSGQLVELRAAGGLWAAIGLREAGMSQGKNETK